ALVLLAPKLCTRRGVNQIHLNVQCVSKLTHTSRHHRAHIQFASNLFRVNFLALETEGGRARDDSQLPQLSETVNQRLRDSIRKILRIRIVARVCQGQDGYRINGARHSPEVKEIRETSSRDYERRHSDRYTSPMTCTSGR